jgi:hypothetical protein
MPGRSAAGDQRPIVGDEGIQVERQMLLGGVRQDREGWQEESDRHRPKYSTF